MNTLTVGGTDFMGDEQHAWILVDHQLMFASKIEGDPHHLFVTRPTPEWEAS